MTRNGHGTAADERASASAGDAEHAGSAERTDGPRAPSRRADPAGADADLDGQRDGERPAPAARPHPAPRPAPVTRDGADGDSESPTVRTTAGQAGSEATTAHAVAPRPHAQPRSDAEATTVTVRASPDGNANGSDNGNGNGNGSWSGADAEATQVLPRAAVQPPVDEAQTERIPITPALRPERPAPLGTERLDLGDHDRGDAGDGGTGARKGGRGRRRLLVLSAIVGGLVLLYGADLLLGLGSVPRGVTVAGMQVGGMSLAEAEQRLRSAIGSRTSGPIDVSLGEASGEIDPATAGLSVDWPRTLQQAGAPPLNPITRITSFFTEREVAVVTDTDQAALTAALEELSPVVDRAPIEGSVRFEGLEPVAVDPVPGQQLDVPAAARVVEREWVTGETIRLPLAELPPTTTTEDVETAIAEVARPAVSAPVTVKGEDGVEGTLTPEVIATALVFRAENGALVPEINVTAVEEALDPQMADSETPGRDATIEFSSGSPVVVPSQDGRGIDYPATVADLPRVLVGPEPREITAVYGDQPAELTTEEIEGLGIKELVSAFTTCCFHVDSGKNIKRAAELIDGSVVLPGETFSLNEATTPRNAANGYVEAGVINDGHPSRGIAGGVSQVATTLYNAAYFAGMVDVEHREHSFYISRYPAGREATVVEGVLDMAFRNDTPTGILIQTHWTPTSLTIRLYGTKHYEVTSTPGPRTKPTEPNTVTIPAGEPCSPSSGAPGFTIADTRTIREIATGEVRREERTVKYNPIPIVICED